MAKIKIYDFFLNHFFIKCQISKLSEGRQNVTFHFPASHYKIKTFRQYKYLKYLIRTYL